jgi:peptidoglycan hydrolase-like protein with peptidoglycan-binding domain
MRRFIHHRALSPLLAGLLLLWGCAGEGPDGLADGTSYVNEGADLWEDVRLDPEGEGFISPAFASAQQDFDLVGFRFDALGEDVPAIEVRVTTDGDGTWSGWIPASIVHLGGVAHEGRAEVPHPGAEVQLRIQTNHPQSISFLAVGVFRSAAGGELDAMIAELGELSSTGHETATDAPGTLSSSRFTLPVPQGGVVLRDNERHFHACRGGDGQSNSACTRLHLGVDIHAKIGVPIVAAADGVVVARSTNSGAGLYLNVRHADGYVSRYLHLDRTRGVSVGSTVQRGQWIADLGETGRAGSGPHLHFEIRKDGAPVDPAPFIGWDQLPRVDTAPRGRVGSGGGGGGGVVGGGSGGNVTLDPGDRGIDVYRLQHLLEAWRPGIMGGSLGSPETATYGPSTLAAVHIAARELRGHESPSSDYTVGPLFWGALVDAIHDRHAGSRRIRYLDTGPEVYRLQHALEAWKPGIMGGNLGAVQTARYGPQTREAVHAAARELRGHESPSSDYTVGPLFWEAMLAAIGSSDTITGGRFMLNPGDTGPDVYRLQHLLEAWRPGVMQGSPGGRDTAVYGGRTLEAVHEAARQLRGHASPSADYTVGSRFWEAVTGALEARFSGSIRIRYGDQGPDVYRLQHALEAWRPGIMGGSLGGIQTATYGVRTRDAVHAAAAVLRGHSSPSDEYTVGPLFWDALLDAIEEHR